MFEIQGCSERTRFEIIKIIGLFDLIGDSIEISRLSLGRLSYHHSIQQTKNAVLLKKLYDIFYENSYFTPL
jgi:hypothetical protein